MELFFLKHMGILRKNDGTMYGNAENMLIDDGVLSNLLHSMARIPMNPLIVFMKDNP